MFDVFCEYAAQAELKTGNKIKKLRCDNGGEFVSGLLKNWCKTRGVILDYSPPFTPQLNGSAERLNLTICQKLRCLLYESGVDKALWGEAALTAAYLINRSPKTGLDCTPYELWNGKPPNLKNIQIFGSKVYAKNLTYLKKLDERSSKYTLVGYAPNGYRLWCEKSNKIIISRDVTFIPVEKADQCDTSDNEPVIYIPNFKINQPSDIGTMTRAGRIVKPPERYGDVVSSDITIPEICDTIPETCDTIPEICENAMMTYLEATTGSDATHWEKAIREEYDSLLTKK